MYNNGTTAIYKKRDIEAFRFRHSLRFGVSEEHLKYICDSFEWKYRAVIRQWSHELHVPPRDSTTVLQI
jgi:hypothetical protein